jgi:hypothetical protein
MMREENESVAMRVFELGYRLYGAPVGYAPTGSEQYFRMREAWIKQGKPIPIDLFILAQANATRDCREDDGDSDDETLVDWSVVPAETR